MGRRPQLSNKLSKVWRVHVWQDSNEKTDFDVELFIGLIPSHKESPNFWHVITQLRTTFFWNQIVPDRQGSAAHEIPNHWISPSLDLSDFGFLVRSYFLSFVDSWIQLSLAFSSRPIYFQISRKGRDHLQKIFYIYLIVINLCNFALALV